MIRAGGVVVALGGALVGLVEAATLWAEDPHATMMATNIAVIGGAVVILVVYAINQISSALIASRQRSDEARKGTLAEQLEKVSQRVEDANRKLHDQRDEANTRQLQYQEQVVSLQKMVQLANEQLDDMAVQYREARTALEETTRKLDQTLKELNSARTERDALKGRVEEQGRRLTATRIDVADLKQHSRDDLPAVPDPPAGGKKP